MVLWIYAGMNTTAECLSRFHHELWSFRTWCLNPGVPVQVPGTKIVAGPFCTCRCWQSETCRAQAWRGIPGACASSGDGHHKTAEKPGLGRVHCEAAVCWQASLQQQGPLGTGSLCTSLPGGFVLLQWLRNKTRAQKWYRNWMLVAGFVFPYGTRALIWSLNSSMLRYLKV